MRRPKNTDFLLDTIGHCFICLNEISTQVKPKVESSALTHSLRYLSRYLKIQMSKVFHENDSIPKHLLDKVERSSLKVSLCEKCAGWNAKLSELFQQLEKIEVEAASYLKLLHNESLEANANGKCNLFRKLDDTHSTDGLTGKIKLEVAETMRRETMQKCSLKLRKVQSRVKIQRLTEEEVLSRTQTCETWISQEEQNQSHREPLPGPASKQEGEVKLEFETSNNNEIGNDSSGDFDYMGGQYDDVSEQPRFEKSTEDYAGPGAGPPTVTVRNAQMPLT